MKKRQTIKWTIIIVLFLLSITSNICLYVYEKGNFTPQTTLTDTIGKQLPNTVLNNETITQVVVQNYSNKEIVDNDKDKSEQKKALAIRLWNILNIVLISLFIASLILFIISKLIKFKNMNEEINNGQQGMQNNQNINSELTNNNNINLKKSSFFNLSHIKPILTSIVIPNLNKEYTVRINCTRQDAIIHYCILPNTNDLRVYTSPIYVNQVCIIRAWAICGNVSSDPIDINIGSSNIYAATNTQTTRVDNTINPATTNTQTTRVDNTITPVTTNTQTTRVDNTINPATTNTQTTRVDNTINPATTNTQTTRVENIITPATENVIVQRPNKIRLFTSEENVIGISYQGDNHVKQNPVVPCQDCHKFTKVNEIWSIAIVSDGAGSKKNSEIGSNAVCAAFSTYLSYMLQNDSRFKNGNIPNERIWDLEFRSLLTRFQTDLKAQEPFKSLGFDTLAATIIILAYSPKGYMFAHVGDGRAGVKVNGEWQTILTPHKGEEANQTIFSTTIEFIKRPTLMMSGVFVPETKVANTPIEAFVLMTDGCENGAWTTYQKINLPNGEFRVEDVNQPRAQVLDNLMQITLLTTDKKEQLIDFITNYNKGFITEGDDKTILIGRVK